MVQTDTALAAHQQSSLYSSRRPHEFLISGTRKFLTTSHAANPLENPRLSTVKYVTDHTVSPSAVLQLGTLYQQPLTTCLHHHFVSTAVSRLNYLRS